ncbi:MAG TPA: CbiX/SirB N-terminal domain-containing protein [Candidatus Methanofastidiosa archaeon]|nr:CbiX/SirB N-terminal domain-containing protein [Candidatus Methanofastidiosa archaeon]HPR41473.1 CbiX/SirB N-terminal domain-containing protein [Candidatus Methanofastidiosa archaeon]
MGKRALVLIGHGSRLPYNSEVVSGLARILEERGAWDEVRYCFNEMNEPNMPDTLDELCRDTEITTIVFFPLFISMGKHTTEDIPRALHIPKGEFYVERAVNGVRRRIVLSGPLGAEEALAELIEKRALSLL